MFGGAAEASEYVSVCATLSGSVAALLIRIRLLTLPFTEGMADLILSTMNGWFAAYNGLGRYPAIEIEEPPWGDPANAYVAGVGLSSTGGDSSNGFGGGSTIQTFPYLTKASQPTYLKPYG